jgi:RimJ/RimL family protein N-acetyltransferase
METPILIEVPEVLAGTRVLVRPYRPGDGQAIFEAIDESRTHILPWMPWGQFHTDPQSTEAQVRKWIARWIVREDMPVGMFELHTGRYLGGSGLHRIDWDVRSFEIGYWIRKSAEGNGYVTEAVQLLSDMAFEALAANRVFIRCAVDNHRSAAVPQRLGFVEEGVLRASIVDADGRIHDARMFSKTRQDWLNA